MISRRIFLGDNQPTDRWERVLRTGPGSEGCPGPCPDNLVTALHHDVHLAAVPLGTHQRDGSLWPARPALGSLDEANVGPRRDAPAP